jgi:TATA-box binding protein (TBP) (component of TFIID and TFIIIB)
MGQVIQMFAPKQVQATYVRSQKAIDLDNKLKLYRKIEEMEFTKQVFDGLVTQLSNPKDSFTARSMAAETQRAIDKLVAEFVGKYGSLDNW